MSSEKKVILVFSKLPGEKILSASSPSLSKLKEKSAILTNVTCKGDFKSNAGAGNSSGETIWEAAEKEDFDVSNLSEPFDMCVIDIGDTVEEAESILTTAFAKTDRTTLLVFAASNMLFFFGLGIAKGERVEAETCACILAPTVAYIADFPVPAQCDSKIVYSILKDRSSKMHDMQKLQTTIINMESAMERATRNPWGKHDCA